MTKSLGISKRDVRMFVEVGLCILTLSSIVLRTGWENEFKTSYLIITLRSLGGFRVDVFLCIVALLCTLMFALDVHKYIRTIDFKLKMLHHGTKILR